MKRLWFSFAFIFILTIQIHADVGKKSKSEVTFQKFGTFKTEEVTKITENKKWTDSKSEFKGKGVFKFAGKMFFKPGDTGELVDLTEMKIYKVDQKKKECEVSPIEKISLEEGAGEGEQGSSEKGEPEKKEEKPDNIKIIRSEFKVNETGNNRTYSNFSCSEYTVLWLTEWENIETGDRGTDSLFTVVWTTPLTDELKQAQEEEMNFQQAYMKAIGIDVDMIQQEILGTNWLSMFQQMSQEEKQNPEQPFSKYAEEMQKIQGYPVVIDGKYFAVRPKPEGETTEAQEENTDVTDIKKTLGLFGKSKLKKEPKESEAPEPTFSYYTELIDLNLAKVGDLSAPANCKMIDQK